MERKFYQELAHYFNAYNNCIKIGNKEYETIHRQNIEQMIDSLPHGSGIDGKTEFNFNKSRENKLIIDSSYHCMDQNGYYDGWIDFSIIITPSLLFDINIVITGKFRKKYESVKEYLEETFQYSLTEIIKTK